MAKEKKKNEWVEWLKAIIIAVILAFIIRNFLFATSIVEGDSMDPTLENGERVIFNKFVYFIGDPERGDIVIIQRPQKNYVKRVIGLPGEKIEIKDHNLFINDEQYEQPFLTEESKNHTGNFGPIEVPKDSYFVMGDHRAISKDSRNGLGFITEEEIIGKSELIIYPFTDFARTK
ncbi:signal peptidase I [Oceanobacillus limi]|uniref:signal peptidase I n=1 Tax=Oceanobacillus limi TaxID=930131 RepID=UPI000B847489|nr:signal peptidase I [Oceanobacillus limi]